MRACVRRLSRSLFFHCLSSRLCRKLRLNSAELTIGAVIQEIAELAKQLEDGAQVLIQQAQYSTRSAANGGFGNFAPTSCAASAKRTKEGWMILSVRLHRHKLMLLAT